MILLKSGLLFWLGGGLAYLYHIDGFPMLAHLQDWLTTEKMHPVQTLLSIFALLIGLTAVASEFLLVPTRRVETPVQDTLRSVCHPRRRASRRHSHAKRWNENRFALSNVGVEALAGRGWCPIKGRRGRPTG